MTQSPHRAATRRSASRIPDARVFEEWLHDRPPGGKRYVVQMRAYARRALARHSELDRR